MPHIRQGSWVAACGGVLKLGARVERRGKPSSLINERSKQRRKLALERTDDPSHETVSKKITIDCGENKGTKARERPESRLDVCIRSRLISRLMNFIYKARHRPRLFEIR